MSTLSRTDVSHLAHLARLAVTDEELDLFAGQLTAVLDAVAQVGKAAVEDVTPTTHAVPMTKVTRPAPAPPPGRRAHGLGGGPPPPLPAAGRRPRRRPGGGGRPVPRAAHP